MDRPVYRIINKSDDVIVTERRADEVAMYLLGRRLDNYIVVKSDDDPAAPNRVALLNVFDYNSIVKTLEAL